MLGLVSVAPRVVARSRSVHEDAGNPPLPVVELKDDQPMTSLQIWLADGRRLVQKFNLSHRYGTLPPVKCLLGTVRKIA